VIAEVMLSLQRVVVGVQVSEVFLPTSPNSKWCEFMARRTIPVVEW